MPDIIPTGLAVNAIAEMPRELAILKMDNESMMSLAAAHPRDHKQILSRLTDQIRAYKSFAESAIYTKPVGKDERGRMKHVSGLSVRAAEALMEAYGYCRVRTSVEPIHEGARVSAAFVDFQGGKTWDASRVVSRHYKTRAGQVRQHPEDRFFDVVCQAAVSKLVREVVLRSVPPGLKSELEAAVYQEVEGFLDEGTTQKILSEFSKYNVTLEQLEGLLGKRRENWTKSDRAMLLGIRNALVEEETTVAEVFGGGGDGAAKDRTQEVIDKIKGKKKAPAAEPVAADEPDDESQAQADSSQSESAETSGAPSSSSIVDADSDRPPAPSADYVEFDFHDIRALDVGDKFMSHAYLRKITPRTIEKLDNKQVTDLELQTGAADAIRGTYWHRAPDWLAVDVEVRFWGRVAKPYRSITKIEVDGMALVAVATA